MLLREHCCYADGFSNEMFVLGFCGLGSCRFLESVGFRDFAPSLQGLGIQRFRRYRRNQGVLEVGGRGRAMLGMKRSRCGIWDLDFKISA